MTTAERIRLLRRHGLENAVIAAVLGAEVADVAAHVHDPSLDVSLGGGGAVDVTGLLPLDGSRAMTGPLKFGHTEIDSIWGGYAIAVESDTHDFGDFVVGSPSDAGYAEIYAVSDPGAANLYLQGAGNNYVAGSAGPSGSYLAVDNDTTFTRLSTAFGLELFLQPDALGIAIRDNSVDVNSYRWQVTPHGEMRWGDGTAAPNVALERLDSVAFWGDQSGFLKLSGPAGLNAGLVLNDYAGSSAMGAFYSDDEVDIRPLDGSYFHVRPRFGLLELFGADSTVHERIAFGGGGYGATITRTAPGTLEIDNTLSFKGVGLGAGATLGWDHDTYGMAISGRPGHKGLLTVMKAAGDYTQGYVAIGHEHGVGDPSIGLRTGDGWLSTLWNAGELGLFMDSDLTLNSPDYGPVLMSPDSSYHRIKVANDGTLSTEPVV